MFDRFERTIKRTLRNLAKQRVRVVLQPGNYLVIDRAIARDDDTEAALQTCQMRGWVEVLHHALPSAQLGPAGELPANFPNFEKAETLMQYRLTSAGWSVIHRSDLIALCALLIAVMSFTLAIFGSFQRDFLR
jgi:hypothetical protein